MIQTPGVYSANPIVQKARVTAYHHSLSEGERQLIKNPPIINGAKDFVLFHRHLG
jgi:hypothetical protein